mmetsp:Transcript_26803/g.61804  ORF Transcript_26803/g.61804 Transcript_26803/m.61804 type:complete len:147 (-) Transcript_26803:445-885(-)
MILLIGAVRNAEPNLKVLHLLSMCQRNQGRFAAHRAPPPIAEDEECRLVVSLLERLAKAMRRCSQQDVAQTCNSIMRIGGTSCGDDTPTQPAPTLKIQCGLFHPQQTTQSQLDFRASVKFLAVGGVRNLMVARKEDTSSAYALRLE